VESWTTLKVLDWTAGRFSRAGLSSPRLDAQVLLAHVLGCDRVGLYTQFDKPLGDEELARARELIRRRLAGEPVAYLVGEREFWSLPLRVDARVLIPRPETETLVQVALDLLGGAVEPSIADIATGSGAVAIVLSKQLPSARVTAVDISADALAVARENCERHGVGERVELLCGDLLEPLGGRPFDLLVANLPYIPSADLPELSPEVRSEPALALDGGADGLDLVRRLVAGAAQVLVPGGAVALEHGDDQGPVICALAREAGFVAPATARDLGDRDRVTHFRAPG